MKKAFGELCFRILKWGGRALGSLPRALLYGPVRMSLYLVIYRVVGYRTAVVRENLRNSFPEKGAAELRAIEREFYRHLAELFVDTLVLCAISEERLLERVTISNLEEHAARVEGCDWIAAMSHYGNWEYFSAYQLLTPDRVIGVYHPLSSEPFDRFFRWLRSRTGMTTVSSRMLLRRIIRYRDQGGRNMAIGLIADQIAPYAPRYKLMMLGQPTEFFEGVETLALRFSMPVYFLRLEKTDVARYAATFQPLWDGREEIREYTIMARYAAMLEEQIRAAPQYWLWSHRRWKDRPWRADIPVEKPERWL